MKSEQTLFFVILYHFDNLKNINFLQEQDMNNLHKPTPPRHTFPHLALSFNPTIST